MVELVDSHCHLNDEKFEEDLSAAVDRAKSAGVTRIINFGDRMATSSRVVDLAHEFDGLFAGVGIHPEEVYEMQKKDDDRIIQFAEDSKVVAIGEIGLDYYWEKDSDRRALQRQIFIHQLDLARQLHLPVCIHDRDAHGDTLEILKKEAIGIRGVLHCFSGSLEMAREVWKLGFLIGVDGPLTFKNAAKLPEVVREVPRELLLIETDSPYMAPVPNRGKRNEPAYVKFVAEKVAEIRGETFEEVAEYTTRNAVDLYNI